MKNVTILLSTYNGEKYLKAQLDSLIAQEGVNVSIFVRDDGSTDRTQEILDAYGQRGLLRWYQGENIGPALSFMDLVKCCEHADYYAFSDQDDIWKKNKLQIAVDHLAHQEVEVPCLFYSNAMIADAQGNPIRSTNSTEVKSFRQIMMANDALGCCMVFNGAFRAQINRGDVRKISMHDWWLMKLIVAIDGKLIFYPQPLMLYRQHGNNVVGPGSAKGKARKWKKRLYDLLLEKRCVRSQDAQVLLANHSESIHGDKLRYVNLLAHYKTDCKSRRALLFDGADGLTGRQRFMKTWAILFNAL